MAGTEEITDDEFCVPIEASVRKPNISASGKGGAKTRLEVCRGMAKYNLTFKLKLIHDYETRFLTNEEMGITEEAIGRDFGNIDQSDRAMSDTSFESQSGRASKGFISISLGHFAEE